MRVQCYQVKLVCSDVVTLPARDLQCAAVAAKVFQYLTREAASEVLMVACLNGAGRLVGVETIFQGVLHHVQATAREIFRLAYLRNASAIILGHNHTSGDPTPSSEDETMTRAVKRIGEAVEIRLLDHIVVTREHWVSIFEHHPLDWQS